MQKIIIQKSTRKDKKFDAILPDGKKVSFGAQGYQDYTMHKDPERKKKYLARHSKDPKSIFTAGGLARDVLWSKPNLTEALRYAGSKHGVRLLLK